MRNCIIVASVLLLCLASNHVQTEPIGADGRPRTRPTTTTTTTTTTERSAPMVMNMTDAESGSDEDESSTGSNEEEAEDQESGEDFNIDSKTAFTCPTRPVEITDLETHCAAEYKAMKRAKSNMTEEEKSKKMNTMESMESGTHASHLGKRETPMGEDMMTPTEASMTNTTKQNMRHRKRSCHYYQCILKKLDVLDEATMLPNEDMFKMWVTNNVTYEGDKTKLQERVVECFNDLRDSGFYNTDSSKSEEVSAEAPNVKKGKTSCNAALKLLKCLSKKETECPAFKFP